MEAMDVTMRLDRAIAKRGPASLQKTFANKVPKGCKRHTEDELEHWDNLTTLSLLFFGHFQYLFL
jgi:hypothetical protein